LRFFWLLLVIAYSAFIFYLSDQPSLAVPALFPQQDKLLHAIAYGVLAFLALNYLKHQPLTFNAALVYSFFYCALYGVSDEWHQSFIDGRQADVFDWLADCSGALFLLISVKGLQNDVVLKAKIGKIFHRL